MHDKSKWKNVKDTLLGSEHRYRNLVELSPDAVAVHCEGKVVFVNPAAVALMGAKDEGELIGKPVMSFVHPDYIDIVKQRIQQTQFEGKVGDLVHEKFIRLDGAVIDVEVAAIPFIYEGKPATQVVLHDITERKQMENLQDVVYRIAEIADRVVSLDELFANIHSMVQEVMPANNFYIALYDRESDMLSFPYFVDEQDEPSLPGKPGKGLTEYVLRTSESLLCDSKFHEELERKGEIELVGIQSPIWLGVPLRVQDDVIGVMVLQDYQNPLAYGEREKRMMEFVSSRIAMAIHRKRNEELLRKSEERYRRQANEFAALFETTRDLTIQRDMTSLLESISERVQSLLSSKGCVVFLYHDEQNALEVKVASGLEQLIGKRIPLADGMSRIVADTLQPMVVDDYATYKYRLEIWKDASIKAMAMAPMQYQGELLGIITVYEITDDNEKESRKYTENDVNLLMFFAGVAASSVHNTILFAETKRRLLELEVLNQISLTATQIKSVTGIAQRIVKLLEDYLNWRRGSIWIVDPKSDALILLAHREPRARRKVNEGEVRITNAKEAKINSGIIGWVCKNNKIIRTGNVKELAFYVEGDPGIQSELCVPLQIGNRTIGCINVESYDSNAFSLEDERLLSTIAGQAAIGIETARLFEETQLQGVRQTALNAIIRSSTQTDLDLEHYLELATSHTLEALGESISALWLMAVPPHLRRLVTRGINDDVGLFLVQIASQQSASMTDTIVINDWMERQSTLSRDILNTGIRSSITVPIMSGSMRIGGLSIASKHARDWKPDEIALVEAIGREIGTSVERAGLFLETRARLSELEMINRISIAARLAHSQNEMLPYLIDDTLSALQAEAGSIWLFEIQKGKLKQAVGRGWNVDFSDSTIGLDEGIVGKMFVSGDVYFTKDLRIDPFVVGEAQVRIPAGWGALCVPIRTEREIIGAFLVCAPQPREFSAEDARLMVTLCEIAGNAIHRMQLFEKTEQHAAELEDRVAQRTGELQKALLKAQAADRMRTEFIANMNHELRTPLTNLVLYYQMIRSQPAIKTEERLDIIGRELQRLRQLIETLLSLSRLDMSKVDLDLKLQNMNTLIKTLVNDRQALADERSLTLEVMLDDHLPEAWLDEGLWTQVVSNLLTNALNYTPVGGHVVVSTFLDSNGRQAKVGFSVQDNGSGIDEKDLPHLFDRFYRGKAAKSSGTHGTGLGLAIVKSIVERHQGQIEVKNIPSGGAIFTVRIPITQKGA